MAGPSGYFSDASWYGTDCTPADQPDTDFVDEPSSFIDHQYTITHSTPIQPARPFTSTHKTVKRRLNLDSPQHDATFKTPNKTPLHRRARYLSGDYPSPSPSKQADTSGSLPSPAERSRHETSLGTLTKRFVGLVRAAGDGVIDLNQAAQLLRVKKRRIYDITNVLEGVGLLEKRSKNRVRLAEATSAADAGRADAERLERQLDQLLVLAGRLAEQRPPAYVRYQDLRGLTGRRDCTVLAIQAPPETTLRVPDPAQEGVYQLHLRSETGEIQLLLCQDDLRPERSPRDDSALTGSQSPLPPPSRTPSDTRTDDSLLTGAESGLGDSLLDGLSGPRVKVEPVETVRLGSVGYGTDCISSEPELAAERSPRAERHDGRGGNTEPQPQTSAAADADLARLEQSDDFLAIEPPLSEADYSFCLEASEGAIDLFDFSF
ncbi:transcription factor E2F1-like isoform X2 [Amphibalanus amphitrite]|nr:transcription factor E2F1-like isoform X2 [Amphibalanus amphitrite]XP_043242798.1 transcription factor E2F1-like isoform X2 [Amphibalanus amphitrite]